MYTKVQIEMSGTIDDPVYVYVARAEDNKVFDRTNKPNRSAAISWANDAYPNSDIATVTRCSFK